jgi:hypothetical protein
LTEILVDVIARLLMKKKTATKKKSKRKTKPKIPLRLTMPLEDEVGPSNGLVDQYAKLERREGRRYAARILLTKTLIEQFHVIPVAKAEAIAKSKQNAVLVPMSNFENALEMDVLSYMTQFGLVPNQECAQSFVRELVKCYQKHKPEYFDKGSVHQVAIASALGICRLVLFCRYGEEAEQLFRLRHDKGHRGLSPHQLGVIVEGDEDVLNAAMNKEQQLADMRYLITLCAKTRGPSLKSPLGSASMCAVVEVLRPIYYRAYKALKLVDTMIEKLSESDDPKGEKFSEVSRYEYERWIGIRK